MGKFQEMRLAVAGKFDGHIWAAAEESQSLKLNFQLAAFHYYRAISVVAVS